MNDMKVRVNAQSESATKTVIKACKFQFVVDEPAELGGTNEGPNPVEYILGAFAGCLSVMAHLIAKEMNIELRSLKLDISGLLNPARLFGKSFDERAGFKEISVVIKADTDADEATLQKWIEAIEDRCPVSDNLQHVTPVNIALKTVGR